MSGSQFSRNDLSLNPARVPDSRRFKIHEIVLARTTSDGSVTNFTAKFGSEIQSIIRVELVEYLITGIPVTGTTPDYPYLRVELSGLDTSGYSNAAVGGGLFLFTAASGPNEHIVYSPPRNIKVYESPISLKETSVKVTLPDATQAVSGTDLTGIHLVLRLWVDVNAPRMR